MEKLLTAKPWQIFILLMIALTVGNEKMISA
jgi:hypothetical protein